MKRIVSLFMVLILTGCATVGSVNRNFESVNYTDGISRPEAKFIAQKYCLDHEECSTHCIISSAYVSDDNSVPGAWRVVFDTEVIDANYYRGHVISVDRETGEVIDFRLMK